MENHWRTESDEFLEAGALERFDEDPTDWFQVGARLTLSTACIGNLYNAAMELSERQRKYLRGLGHALNPVLLIGNAGVTPAVIAEAKRALHDHELIKVKFRGAEREARDAGLVRTRRCPPTASWSIGSDIRPSTTNAEMTVREL